MHNNWLFIRNVVAHWVGTMSGVVSITFGVIEYFRKKKAEATIFAAIAICMIFVSSGQAWQDEHRNSENLKGEKNAIVIERDFWKEETYKKDGELQAANQVLAQNFNALAESQKTGDETQKSLTHLSERILEIGKPQAQRTTILYEGRESPASFLRDSDGNNIAQWLLLTNKLSSPTTVEIACSRQFLKLPRVVILTPAGGATLAAHQQVSPTQVRFTVQSPWSPQAPMLVEIPFQNSSASLDCSIGTK